MQDVVRLP